MTKKIKILFLCADPRGVGYRPLLKRELREIDAKIRSSSNSDVFKLKSEWAVRPDDLQEALLKHHPHILHLSTHANRAEGIFLEDDFGEKKPISTGALADLLGKLENQICIVFLNACYTKRQMKPFTRTVDYTIAMNTSIGDRGAIVFAASFYRGLAFGLPVKAAFDLAISQLALENIPDTKTPVLLVKEGIDMSRPFLSTVLPKSGVLRAVRGQNPQAMDSHGDARNVATRAAAEPTPSKGRGKKRKDTKETDDLIRVRDAEARKLIKKIRTNIKRLEALLSEETT